MPVPVRTRPFPRRLAIAAAALLALPFAVPGCAARQVEVTTGAEPASALSVEFTNNYAQAVNVYLRAPGASEIFLRQVPARSTESVPLRNLREGATVQLRVAPVDGSAGVARDNVVVGRGTVVRVP